MAATRLRCASSWPWALLFVCSFALLYAAPAPFCAAQGGGNDSKEVYIVRLEGSTSDIKLNADVKDHAAAAAHHARILRSVHTSHDEAKESHLYSYRNVVDGFSAALTAEQAASLADMPGVRSLHRSRELNLLTTRSWDFLGLSSERNGSGAEATEAKYGADVIVGVIDSGIWPESPSFSDHGFTPVPARWRGKCMDGQPGPDGKQDFIGQKNCNRKIVGARYYVQGFLKANNNTLNPRNFVSPRDSDGHGSHVASTIAGRYVEQVSVFGTAEGAARGGAPFARLAIYKACWPFCYEADVLAAFDDAIDDGVDILSVSLGYNPPQEEYFEDPIAIGAYQALKKGILTVCAGGNSGFDAATVTGSAPWIFTVAATSMDRLFLTPIKTGNNVTVVARNVLIQPSASTDSMYPLEFASSASLYNDQAHLRNASLCIYSSLDPKKVAGKILVCELSPNQETNLVLQVKSVMDAGGSGVIFAASARDDLVFPWPLPVGLVSGPDAAAIYSYIRSTTTPVARIGYTVTVTSTEIQAPTAAAFSSRGPNKRTPEIIKPDIAAPGVGIVAAWSPVAPISEYPGDARRLSYHVHSGTSMATPHVTAVAALVKSAHPTWSPAAVKSAIMTTATRLDNTGWPIVDIATEGAFAGPYAVGAGQINPNRAIRPGLTFDSSPDDYALLLCASGYNATSVATVVQASYACPHTPPAIKDLNYPSVHFTHASSSRAQNTVSRTVTNVGKANSVYRASLISPLGTQLSVTPRELKFTAVGQKLNFTISLSPKVGSSAAVQQVWGAPTTGAVVWIEDKREYIVSVLVLMTP